MIDLKIFLARADGTAAVLPLENRGYVIGREAAAIGCDAGAPVVRSDAGQFAHSFWVGFLPALQHLVSLLTVLLLPALYFCAMARRIFGASRAGAGSIAIFVPGIPAPSVRDAAGSAQPALDRSFVMAVRTFLTDRVMAFAALFGGQPRRMPGSLGSASHRGFDRALSASAARYGSFGDMPFTARVAGEVKALASRFSRSPFRGRFHMFIVMSPA